MTYPINNQYNTLNQKVFQNFLNTSICTGKTITPKETPSNDEFIKKTEKATPQSKNSISSNKKLLVSGAILLGIGVGIYGLIASAGASFPLLVSAGLAIGTTEAGLCLYNSIKAKNTKSEKHIRAAGFHGQIGLSILALSLLSAKKSLNYISDDIAHLTQEKINELNIFQVIKENFKAIPQSIKSSFDNIFLDAKLKFPFLIKNTNNPEVNVIQIQLKKSLGLKAIYLGEDVKFAQLVSDCLNNVKDKVDLKGLNFIVDEQQMKEKTLAAYNHFYNTIRINPILFKEQQNQQMFTVYHELGHCFHGQKTPLFQEFYNNLENKSILPFKIPKKLDEQFLWINDELEEFVNSCIHIFYNRLNGNYLSSHSQYAYQEYTQNQHISEFVADVFAAEHMARGLPILGDKNTKKIKQLYNVFLQKDKKEMIESLIKASNPEEAYNTVGKPAGWTESYEDFVKRSVNEILDYNSSSVST